MQDAWSLAERYHAEFRFDEISLSSGAKLKDSDGIEKTIWLLDAASAFNHMRTALSVRPAGVALWQLGYEDPGVWEFLGRGRLPDNAALKGLQNIEPGLTSGVEKSNVLVQALPLTEIG